MEQQQRQPQAQPCREPLLAGWLTHQAQHHWPLNKGHDDNNNNNNNNNEDDNDEDEDDNDEDDDDNEDEDDNDDDNDNDDKDDKDNDNDNDDSTNPAPAPATVSNCSHGGSWLLMVMTGGSNNDGWAHNWPKRHQCLLGHKFIIFRYN